VLGCGANVYELNMDELHVYDFKHIYDPEGVYEMIVSYLNIYPSEFIYLWICII
jgi:hypothetical protein